MKKLLIAATLAAAAVAATPLLAQTDKKPDQTAATEGCRMAGGHETRGERMAQMDQRQREMHGRMAGAREGMRGHGTRRGACPAAKPKA